MRRRAAGSGLVAAIVIVAALAAASTAAAHTHARSALRSTGVLIPAHPGQVLPLHGGTTSSLNWSGYAVTPGSGITGVSGTFVVPSAGLDPPGFAATWAGIGGYNTSDLIQAGVEEQSAPSDPVFGTQYTAWYEILPASETPLTNCSGDSSCTVTPGDHVTVDISNVSGNTWSVSLTDAGKWSWSQDITYSSSESSAEWILEAPTVGAQTLLANVGTVAFGPTSTYTAGGATNTIAAGNPTQIDLGTGVVNEATPSALASDGQSFNDCAYAVSCPTP
jgi:Peptidase A4 family